MANLNSGSRSGASTIITYRMLLDAIKTIDGHNSGIDADLLDGHHADYFSPSTHLHDSRYVLKSGDRMTGGLTFSTGAAISTDVTTPFQIGYSNTHGGATISSYARIRIMANTDNGADEPIQLVTGNGLNVDETKGLLIYKEDIKYNNNRVWTAGNDGAGSGLDADTVDGIQAERMIYGDGSNAVSHATDANALWKSGIYDFMNGRNLPTSDQWYWLINAGHRHNTSTNNSKYGMQLAAANGTDQFWFRTTNNAGVGNWARVYTTRYKPTPADIGAVNKAGDTMTGPLKFTNSTASITNANEQFQIGKLNTSGSGSAAIASVGTLRLLANTDSVDDEVIQLATGWGLTTDTAHGLTIYKSDIKYNNNRVWHAGNDGAGSGLDADTVDGIQAERMIYGENNTGSINNSSINNITKSGFYRTTNQSATDNPLPDGNQSAILHVQNPSYPNYRSQLAFPYYHNKIYFRSRDDNGWQSWHRIYHTDNKPTPAEIGAVNKAGDTMSGYLELVDHLMVKNAGNQSATVGLDFHNNIPRIRYGGSGAGSTNGFTIQGSGDSIKFKVADNGELYAKGTSLVWHKDNDGSGSGLDADMVDGIEASRIVYGDNASASSPVDDLNTLWKSGFYDITNGRNVPPGNPSGGWYWVINTGHRNNNGTIRYGMQIVGSNERAELFFRNRTNNGSAGWNRVWNSGNQGSGSGMDSDKVDGYHATTSNTANNIVVRDGSNNINVSNVSTDTIKIKNKVNIQFNTDTNAIEFVVI